MSFFSLADGTRLRFSERGTGEKTFILVHGWKQSHRLFDKAITSLSRRHRVISFDQRGMGESEKPNSEYNFETLGEDLLDVLEHFDVTDATLVGWSMGCTTSLSAMGRDSSRVGRLVLMNGPLRLIKSADFSLALEEKELRSYIQGMEDDWPNQELIFYQASLLAPREELIRLLFSVGIQTPLDIALKLIRAQAELDHRQTIRDLEIPILAAYSRQDPYWPIALAEWIATNAQNGSLHIFEHSAHCPPLEEAENFVQVIENFANNGTKC